MRSERGSVTSAMSKAATSSSSFGWPQAIFRFFLSWRQNWRLYQLAPLRQFVGLGEHRFLARPLVDEAIEPLRLVVRHARPGRFNAYLHGAGGRQCVRTADPPPFMRYPRSALISPILDLNPLERARMELKLAPGFLVRSAPKPRRVVDRIGA